MKRSAHPACSLLHLTSLCLFMLLVPSCTTTPPIPTNPLELSQLRAKISGPAGYLGLTTKLNLAAVQGSPYVEFVFLETVSRQKLRLRADIEMKSRFGPTGIYPLIFPVPQGEYSLLSSKVWVPGGVVYGQRVQGTESSLGLERHLTTFTVRDNMFLHLAKVSINLRQRQMEESLWFNVEAKLATTRPSRATWEPFLPALNKSLSFYLRKTKKGTWITPPIRWDSANSAKEDDGISDSGNETFTEKDIKKVNQFYAYRIKACHLKHAPGTKGLVSLEFIIAPAGRVLEANVVTSTLESPETESCIINIYKKMRFPPTPSDDFETWTSDWAF